MFLFEKKIVYLTFFWDGVKKSSAGFVKVSREKDACRLDIHIKHIDGLDDGKYALSLALRSRETEWGSIAVKGGAVNEERSLLVRGEKIRLGEEEFDEGELCGILIRLDKSRWIAGYWQETAGIQENLRENTQEDVQDHGRDNIRCVEPDDRGSHGEDLHAADECIREPVPEEDEKVMLKPALGNKWEQLQRTYKSVHPFGDGRLYLTVEPKDFIVLQAPYQRLVNNSFLLHGYYNYRHLILGPDREIGTGNEICFYLGVPGTYFEREKMVAVMFGFEGFECAGPVEIGKFGYYMRRVEL